MSKTSILLICLNIAVIGLHSNTEHILMKLVLILIFILIICSVKLNADIYVLKLSNKILRERIKS